MSNDATTRTPKVGETWRHKSYTSYTINVRYVDDLGACGADEGGQQYTIRAGEYRSWEPVPPARPSVDFTRWGSSTGWTSSFRQDNAHAVRVWSDEDGALHAEWVDA